MNKNSFFWRWVFRFKILYRVVFLLIGIFLWLASLVLLILVSFGIGLYQEVSPLLIVSEMRWGLFRLLLVVFLGILFFVQGLVLGESIKLLINDYYEDYHKEWWEKYIRGDNE